MMSTPEKHQNPRVTAIRARRDPQQVSRIQKAMRLAATIEDAIKEKGWNRSRFAEAMGVRPSQVTRWLSGTQGIHSDTLFDIEYVLGVLLVLPEPVKVIQTEYVVVYKTLVVPVGRPAVIDSDMPLFHNIRNKKRNKQKITSCEHASTGDEILSFKFYAGMQTHKYHVN